MRHLILPIALITFPALAAEVIVDVRGVPKPPAAPALDEATAAKARATFAARCAMCHGERGEGDGPSAPSLDPKPRRFSDALWQASVTDEQLRQVILLGGGARKLSTMMLASPDLKASPDIVDALVAFIRSRRAPHGTARLTFGAGPAARVAFANAVPGGAVRFAVLDVVPGSHPIVVHTATGELCRDTATVGADDLTVVCEHAGK